MLAAAEKGDHYIVHGCLLLGAKASTRNRDGKYASELLAEALVRRIEENEAWEKRVLEEYENDVAMGRGNIEEVADKLIKGYKG